MHTVTVTLESLSPYGQSRYHNTPKKEKESSADYEERTWRERGHWNKNGRMFIPPMAFKHCLAECAKFLGIQIPGRGKERYTKHFASGIMVTDGLVLPVEKADVEGLWLHVPADGTPGGRKRVEKCFPYVEEWSGDVVYYVLDDTITKTVFEQHMEQAGQFIGIGFFRPANRGYWGRFKPLKFEWE